MPQPYYLIRYQLGVIPDEYVFREVDSASRKIPKVFEPDSPKYFDWLKSLKSFRFEGKHGSFVARQEGRVDKSGKQRHGYWTAYRKVKGQQFRKYLGMTDKLSAVHLEEVAAQLETTIKEALHVREIPKRRQKSRSLTSDERALLRKIERQEQEIADLQSQLTAERAKQSHLEQEIETLQVRLRERERQVISRGNEIVQLRNSLRMR